MARVRHNVKDIKNADTAHPFSRKAMMMKRNLARAGKLHDASKRRAAVQDARVTRLLFFKFALPEDLVVAEPRDVEAVVDLYLRQYDDEDAAARQSARAASGGTRRPAPRLTVAQAYAREQLRVEAAAFEKGPGFSLPDLMNAKNVAWLRKWEGDWNAVHEHLKMVSVTRPELLKLQAERDAVAAAAPMAVEPADTAAMTDANDAKADAVATETATSPSQPEAPVGATSSQPVPSANSATA